MTNEEIAQRQRMLGMWVVRKLAEGIQDIEEITFAALDLGLITGDHETGYIPVTAPKIA